MGKREAVGKVVKEYLASEDFGKNCEDIRTKAVKEYLASNDYGKSYEEICAEAVEDFKFPDEFKEI
ncbi:hypothetical protein L484_014066 [Morus notabilis]|uniref:Uncharacterized protein n=1 Tax=Morus notabilis TaxID=981085 RepID=W9QDK7_9ROSA|nr:hypothetical protein L484_014066 [Morus notabilis]